MKLPPSPLREDKDVEDRKRPFLKRTEFAYARGTLKKPKTPKQKTRRAKNDKQQVSAPRAQLRLQFK